MSDAHTTPSKLVLATVEDAVGTIILNRPQSLNAFNLDLARQFLATLTAFDADQSVRAIVLKGAGRAFSCGGDIKEMLADVKRGDDRAAYFRAPLSAFGNMVLGLRRTPKPVLAAVHGAAAGVAFNLMLACDLKIASESCRFTQAFIKIGLSPDGGGSWFLPRLVGAARASEMALLPTELNAETAREWGLINWVVRDDRFEEEVSEIAARLAEGPADAMARAKALLNAAYDSPLSEHIETERLAQIDNAASTDFGEGLTAFVEKRVPRFRR